MNRDRTVADDRPERRVVADDHIRLYDYPAAVHCAECKAVIMWDDVPPGPILSDSLIGRCAGLNCVHNNREFRYALRFVDVTFLHPK